MARPLLTLLLIFLFLSLHAQGPNRETAFLFLQKMGKGANLMAAKVDGFYFDTRDAEILVENHFTHIRLGAKLDRYTGPAPVYEIDPVRLNYVRSCVDILLDHGLMVVLDPLHQYNEVYTNADLPRLRAIWHQIALTFSQHPVESLCFEIMNEPHDDYNLYDLVHGSLSEIRSVPGNEHRMVIVSGQGFSTRQALIDAFDQDIFPPDDPALIGTYHYYDPRPFTNQGTMGETQNWAASGDSDPDWVAVTAAFTEVSTANSNWAARNNSSPLPVYLGEYGVDNAAPLADRKRWLWWIRNQAEYQGFAHALWNMYNDSPDSKGIGPWTNLQKQDPSTRYLRADLVETLLARYEAEEGVPVTGCTIDASRTDASETAIRMSQAGDAFMVPGIYQGKSGDFGVYLRVRNEGPLAAKLILRSRKGADSGFGNETSFEIPPGPETGWATVQHPVYLPADTGAVLSLELAEGSGLLIDFIAISLGQYYEHYFPGTPVMTGMEDLQENTGFLVHPNPCSGYFWVREKDDAPGTSFRVSISDLTGRILQVENITSHVPFHLQPGISPGPCLVQVWIDGQETAQDFILIKKE